MARILAIIEVDDSERFQKKSIRNRYEWTEEISATKAIQIYLDAGDPELGLSGKVISADWMRE